MASLEDRAAEPATAAEHRAGAKPAAEAELPVRASVLEFYRTIWQVLREVLVRYRVVIVVEVVLIAAWFVLRTVVSVESRPYLAWTVVAGTVAVISPTSGLVILAATGPFFEPVTLTRAIGMRHVLVAVLGLSVAFRIVLGGWRRMPWSPPIFLGIAIGVLTALGVVLTYQRFPLDWAEHAAGSWLASVGSAMILLIVATWVARNGAWRPVLAAIAGATVAIGLSVAEYVQRGVISGSQLEWIGFWKDFGARIGGVIASPNGMAALAVMPVCVLAAFAILTADHSWRALLVRGFAALAAGLLFLAMYVTYSRAALLSLFGLAVVVTWRINRRLGQVVLVGGIVAGIALLPSYLALRAQVGAEGALEPGSLLVTTDALRLQAWDSALHMFLAQPMTGEGFLAYKQLADAFGDTVLSSPHNEWLRLFAEEGAVTGIVGLAFVVITLWWLARRRDSVGSGILAGAFGYLLMASFNNPFLFVQVSVVAFTAIGFGLAQASKRDQPVPANAMSG